MKHMRKRILGFFLAFALIVSSCMPAFAEDSARPEENLQARYIKDIVREVAKQYRFDVSESELYEAFTAYVMNEHPELLEGAIRAVTSDLDPFSGYYSRDELVGFGQFIEPNYVGIGIEITRAVGCLEITGVTPGSPAEAAGIKAGDQIATINGEDATHFNIDMAAERVRGEEGTTVNLGILREDQLLSFTVTRANIASITVTYETVDGIGYMKISQFNSTTPDDVKAALSSFDSQGVKQIIADVRDNPGGELNSVLKVLYQIVPEGMPLTTIDYNGEERDVTFCSNAKFKETDRTFVVLINENTASAAELFAGAIRENKVGITMGVRSYGKGTVQEFMGLNSLGGEKLGDIKLTVAEYTMPSGESIHKKGVEPDIEVKNQYTPFETEDLAPMVFEGKYTVGDSGDGVLAIEQRLDGLGYQAGELDGVFDEELELAVYSFQSDAGLYPYGVMDITTQTYLKNVCAEMKVLHDLQIEAAWDYFKDKAGTQNDQN